MENPYLIPVARILLLAFASAKYHNKEIARSSILNSEKNSSTFHHHITTINEIPSSCESRLRQRKDNLSGSGSKDLSISGFDFGTINILTPGLGVHQYEDYFTRKELAITPIDGLLPQHHLLNQDPSVLQEDILGDVLSSSPRTERGLSLSNYLDASRNIGKMGGFRPNENEEDDEVLGGQSNELMGGNYVSGATGSQNVTIFTTDMAPPTLSHGQQFRWAVRFNTTGRNGWIIQELTNTYYVTDPGGISYAPPFTPHYWEAWSVDANGSVDPALSHGIDVWKRMRILPGTTGYWEMSASLYFTTNPITIQGFSRAQVPDAGLLLSTTSQPPALKEILGSRWAECAWDTTGITPTFSFHTISSFA